MKAEPVFKEMVQPISFGSFGHVAYSCAGHRSLLGLHDSGNVSFLVSHQSDELIATLLLPSPISNVYFLFVPQRHHWIYRQGSLRRDEKDKPEVATNSRITPASISTSSELP
jgi:hypothetical protein